MDDKIYDMIREPNDSILITGSFVHETTLGTYYFTAKPGFNSAASYVARITNQGKVVWVRKILDGGGIVVSVRMAKNGTYYVLALLQGTDSLLIINNDTIRNRNAINPYRLETNFLVKYSHDWKPLWAKPLAVDGSQNTQLVLDHNDLPIISGVFVNSYLPGKNIANQHSATYLAKFGTNGDTIWTKVNSPITYLVKSMYKTYTTGLQTDSKNDIYISGCTYTDTIPSELKLNFWVKAYDPNGKLLRVFKPDSSTNSILTAIVIDSFDNIYLNGNLAGKNIISGQRFDLDTYTVSLFLCKMDTLFRLKWNIFNHKGMHNGYTGVSPELKLSNGKLFATYTDWKEFILDRKRISTKQTGISGAIIDTSGKVLSINRIADYNVDNIGQKGYYAYSLLPDSGKNFILASSFHNAYPSSPITIGTTQLSNYGKEITAGFYNYDFFLAYFNSDSSKSNSGINLFLKSETQLVIFPNPAQNYISIALPKEGVSAYTYQIINSSGQLVGKGSLMFNLNNIDISYLLSGLYHISVFKLEGEASYYSTFIKTK